MPSASPPDAPPPAPPRPSLVDELRERRGDFVRTGGVAGLVSLLAFVAAFWFIEPPPPGEIAIAAGDPGGAYAAAAQSYAASLERHGVRLKIVETAGTVENYRLLASGEVRLAILQSGAAPAGADTSELESLGTLFLEPLWVFHRPGLEVRTLADLSAKRVAVGSPGSGCRSLALKLLDANGVARGPNAAELIGKSGRAAINGVAEGELDAAMIVLSAESPLIAQAIADDRLALLDMERGLAYSRRYPFLRTATLARGVLDLRRDLPPRDARLVGPVANLVATPELHDAFIPLLLEAAEGAHQSGGLLCPFGEHPRLEHVEFTPSAVASHYFKNGPSLFQRYLGFWVASLIDRTKIMIVPLVLLMLPILKVWRPVYRWRIRSRIYRWYVLLRETDQQLRRGVSADLDAMKVKLEAMEDELEGVSVPLSYMEEFYHLRLHIDLVLRRIEDLRTRSADRA